MAKPGTFPPGVSGNPRGRAKSDFSLAELARKHTGEALKVLVQVLHDPEHPQRVTAAKELLDRGWGKAPMILAADGMAQTITIRLEQPMSQIKQAEVVQIAS